MRLILTALLVAACTPVEEGDALDGFVSELEELPAEQAAPPVRVPPRLGGCGDVAFWASNNADTVGLHVFAQGLIDQALMSPTTTLVYAYNFQLPSADMNLSFEVGTDITANDCNDVLIPNTIRQTWVPVSGDAHVLLNLIGPPTPWGAHPAEATLTLTDLVVEETTTGRQRTLPDMVLPDVYVGWFPG